MTKFIVILDEVVTECLEQMAREQDVPLQTFVADTLTKTAKRHRTQRRLLELIDKSTLEVGSDWRWNREDLYDRAALRRHERDPVADEETEQ